MGDMPTLATSHRTRKLKAPLRPPTRQRALYSDKDLTDKTMRYQGVVSSHGARSLESCRKFLGTITGRGMDRISDADLFDYLGRCWHTGEEDAQEELRRRGLIK